MAISRAVNLFSSDPFLRALGRAAFPGRHCAPSSFRVGDRLFRLLVVDGKRPLTRWPFLDFHEPITDAGPELGLLDYLPHSCTERLEVSQWDPGRETPEVQPSPLVDWTGLPDWEAYEALLKVRRKTLLPDTRRSQRVLQRELGELELIWDDARPQVFDSCVEWKSRQYLAGGLKDLFADPRHVALFRELRAEGVLRVSSLSAGGVLLAAHLGALLDGRFYYWIPAYDPTFARYSPGRVLLTGLLERSFRSGHREFDFLIGNEPYKWLYATHTRVVSPAGAMPLAQRVQRVARQTVSSTLRKMPWLWAHTEELRRRLR